MTDEARGAILRLAAFTADPAGGNPAGVWIGDALPSDADMQRIAAAVGYSETAFLAPDGTGRPGTFRVRYFSPLAEVPFCGHATIAAGVALAERGLAAAATDGRGDDGHARDGELVVETNNGPVPISVATGPDGRLRATLTSVEPRVDPAPPTLVEGVLALLGWDPTELDPGLPPAIAYAGVFHLVLGVRTQDTLGRMAYPFEPMQALMGAYELTTIQLIRRDGPGRFRARDPFAVGGVVEDPATGAAAAAFGAYLRARGEIEPPATFEIAQGVEMGRPSLLTVTVVPGDERVRVSGTAVPIPAP